MMINWLERHPCLVLERCGAGHFCRSAISCYNAQCETLNICCFFFYHHLQGTVLLTIRDTEGEQVTLPHVFLTLFLKTTISWIMTGHVASARSESPKPSASQTKHHGSVRAWTKEETALLDKYREDFREANDTACSHCSHYYTWTLPNVPAGLMHGVGKYPRLGYFPTVSPISLGEAVVHNSELNGGVHCWWQCQALFSGSSAHFQIRKWALFQIKSSNKIGKNLEKKIGDGAHCWWWCWALFCQGPVRISKYGRCGYAEWKKAIKYGKKSEKNRGMVGDDVQGGVLFSGSSGHFQIWKKELF